LLQALSYIKDKYPDVTVAVAGNSLVNYKTLKDKIKISAYGKYLRKFIKELEMEDKITFLGKLSAEEMKQQYLKCHTFVCASSLENSPNSVGNDNLYAAYWQLKNQGKTPKGIKIKTDSSGAKYIPATIPNQEAVFKAVIEATIQGGGSGVFYWGGEWISVNKDDYGSMGSSWENQALFDFEGKALPALELYSLETK